MVVSKEAVPSDSAPSLGARVLAFLSVVIAGACGGLIGFAVIDIGCDGGCTERAGLVGLAAAVAAATGTAVVAVLVLRSSAEWRAYRQSLPSSDTPDTRYMSSQNRGSASPAEPGPEPDGR